MTLTVYIGGVEMTGDSHFVDEGSPSHVNAMGQWDTFSCRIVSKDGSYTPAIGAAVEVHDDVGLRFGGSIRDKSADQFGASLSTTIDCSSWEQIAMRRLVGAMTSLPGETYGEFFERIRVDHLATEGVTSSIVAGTPVISPPISLDWCNVREAYDLIAAQASSDTTTYMWDFTPDKVARLFKQTSFAAPMNVSDASTDVMRPITIKQSFGGSGIGYANKAYVRVAELVTDPRTTTHNCDGSETSLTHEGPIASAPTINVNGVEDTSVGIRDYDTGKNFYWQDGSNSITWDASVDLTGDEVEIIAPIYQTTVVDAGQVDDEVAARSIAEDNSGWYMVLLDSSTRGTQADAIAIGQAWLAKYANGVPRAVEYVTTTNGVRAGQYQTINLSGFGETVNATFIIESVTLFQAGPNYGFRVRAVNGALANGWLANLRKIATGQGGSSASGGTVIESGATNTPAGNVTIDSVTPDPRPIPIVNARGTSKGTQRGVEIRYTPPDPIGTFKGSIWQVEAPDQSAESFTPLDGSVALDGSTNLGGPKEPLTFGPFAHSDVDGILRVIVPEPRKYPMSCRARAISFSDTVTNDAATSPSLVFVINEPTVDKPNSGTAHAQNPLAVTILETGTRSVGGVLERYIRVSFDPPDDPKFVGVQWIVRSAAGETINASGIQAETTFELAFQEPASVQTVTVYALGSDGVNINPLVDGITPSDTVEIGTADGTVNLAAATVASMGLGLGSDGVKLDVQIAGPIYEDVDGNINLKIANDFVVEDVGGVPTLTQNVVDLMKATNFSASEFEKTGGNLVIKGLAVNKLVAGDALFAGDATFARSGGGKVTINSAGVAIADHLSSPTATVTATSSGVTVAKGSNNVQVTASGVAINGPSGTLTATSSGVVISNGSSSVTVSSSAVTIVNGSLSVSNASGSASLDATNFFRVTNTSGWTVYVSWLGAGATVGSNSSLLTPTGVVVSNSGTGRQMAMTSDGFTILSGGSSYNTSNLNGQFIIPKFPSGSAVVTVVNGVIVGIV